RRCCPRASQTGPRCERIIMWTALFRRPSPTRRRARTRSFRPRLDALEGRLAPAGNIFLVTNTGDNDGVDPNPGAGTGTLRQAIVDATANGGPDEIKFEIPGSGPRLIQLQMPPPDPTTTTSLGLPAITDSVFLDGWIQGGFSYHRAPLIQI